MTQVPPEELRRTIFADLVAAQDAGVAVPDSRVLVAARHGVSVDEE